MTLSTHALMMRAAMSNVAQDLREAYDRDIETLDQVAASIENVDWGYFDNMSDEDLCEHVAHDFDASSCGTVCYNCGAERTNGGVA